MEGEPGRLFSLSAVALGCLFSAVVGHVFVRLVLDPLRRATPSASPRPYGTASSIQGVLERVLYTAAWYFGQPGFIAVWLGVKSAGQWKRWGETGSLNLFLVGSGLSVLYGAAGGRLIQWLRIGHWSSAVLYPLALLVGTVILRLWAAGAEKGGRE